MNARQTAFIALRKVAQGAYSSIALGKTLGETALSQQDRSLAGAIFYGVLKQEGQLDDMLRPLLSRPVSKLERDVLIILRMGIYQIGFMDKIPESAAVNESVKLAKQYGYSKASGLVNAVLRGYIKSRGASGGTDADSTTAPQGATVPDWLRELWERDYGEETARGIIGSIAGKPPVYVRLNSLASAKLPDGREFDINGVRLRRIDWLDGAAQVLSRGSVIDSRAYREGLLYMQDISSQLCCAMTGVRAGQDVLDACAAPGGKAFTMAQLMGGKGTVTARDIHSHRVGLIEKGAKRLGIECVKAERRDAAEDGGEAERFDTALCDVPCSGLGVIRRKPDILKKTAEEIETLPELQLKIMEAAAGKVKPGGILMYSTCTLRRAENGGVVDRFLERHGEFSGETLPLPRGGLRTIDEPDWSLTLFPQTADSDGFYMAKLRKNGGAAAAAENG